MTRCANPESNGNNWGVIGHESALSVRSGHHWIIEDCSITWANAQGLDLGGEGWTSTLQQQPVVSDEMGGHQVRRCYVSHHGVAGIVGWAGGVHHVLLEDNVTNENCLKDNFYLYEAAGVKFHQAQDCIIRRHRSHGNHAFGIWLDYNCSRNRITQCTLTNNRGAGIFLEVSPGPALVDNNVVIGTRSPSGGPWADGLYSHDNNGGTWANNLIMDNEGWGVRLRFLRDREALGGPTTAHRNRVYNNFIVRNGQGAIYLHPESERATDNRSDHNLFWGQEAQMQFFLDNSGCGVRWEGTPWGQAFGRSGEESLPLTAEEWRRYRGWDEHSVVRPPETMLPALSQEIKIDPLRPLANLLDQLTALWPADAPPLDAGYGPYEPQPVTAMQARHKASL
jgi:parallel beta-helix repeat protein